MNKEQNLDIDTKAEIKKIHDNLDASFGQLINSLEESKRSIKRTGWIMTRKEIEKSTERSKMLVDNWSVGIAIMPLLLAVASYIG